MKKMIIHWLVFIVVELFVVWFYLDHSIRCEPCLEGSPCPPCISEAQVVSYWTGILIAVVFIVWQAIRLINTRRNKIN